MSNPMGLVKSSRRRTVMVVGVCLAHKLHRPIAVRVVTLHDAVEKKLSRGPWDIFKDMFHGDSICLFARKPICVPVMGSQDNLDSWPADFQMPERSWSRVGRGVQVTRSTQWLPPILTAPTECFLNRHGGKNGSRVACTPAYRCAVGRADPSACSFFFLFSLFSPLLFFLFWSLAFVPGVDDTMITRASDKVYGRHCLKVPNGKACK